MSPDRLSSSPVRPYDLELCLPREARALLASESALGRFLSREERDKLDSFRAPKRRLDWIAGRIAAKRALKSRLASEGTRLEDAEIEILNRKDGSPRVRLPGTPEYLRRPLSISHTAACAAAALAEPGHLAGVDVEMIETRADSFLRLVAHDSERDERFLSDPAEQTEVWTLKEAVSKILGTGLSVGFWDIRFLHDGKERRLQLHGAALKRWRRLGKPAICFDSRREASYVLSAAYTAGDAHA